MAIDAGVPPAFMLAMTEPKRVTSLVLMESLVGLLPGAEAFLAGGPPWWFGFHSVPGLAETVIEDHEAEYIDFFLKAGTADKGGIDPAIREAFIDAYRGIESLRCAFEYYRAGPTNAVQIERAVSASRLVMPVMTVGGNTVGSSTFRQLEPIADNLEGHLIENSGHIIPLDQPDVLTRILLTFLDSGSRTATSATSA